MVRVFVYGDERWEDPGEEFSSEDVRRHLTAFFPELAQATIQEKTLEDGTVEVTLIKMAGTKGGEQVASLQVASGKFAGG